MKNGLIVVKRALSWYHGVDREPRPLQYENLKLHREICRGDNDILIDEMTSDLLLAQAYAECALKHQLLVELLYCEFFNTIETKLPNKLYCEVGARATFLGWDYALDTSDLYSCIKNDISLHADLLANIVQKLNQYGLFSTIDDLNEFIDYRNTLKHDCPKGFFEIGEFSKVKVFVLPAQ